MAHSKSAKLANPLKTGRPHRVVMLGYPDAQILDITGPLEVFGRTARLLQDRGISHAPAYEVELVGLKPGAFATSSGVRLMAERGYREVTSADTLLIAGGFGCTNVMQDQDVLRWIRRLAPKVRRLGSVCTGSLILAHTGLLDGRAATTHWDDTQAL